MAQLEQARISNSDGSRLAAEALYVAGVAAELGAAGLGAAESQVIPFGLTASMARLGAEPEDVVEAILTVRRIVIATAGLDPTSEPVPLVVGDPRVAAVNLAVYLQGLLDRAATATGTGRAEVSARVLAELDAG